MARARKTEDEPVRADAPLAETADAEATAGGEQKSRGKRGARKAPAGEGTPSTRRTRKGDARETKPVVRRPKPEHPRGRRKERRGVVVSNAMDKTIVVRVDAVKPDPRYKKVIRRSRKFHAHDEENVANVGDVVRIVETRPLSKMKTWRLAEVVEAAR